MRRRKVKGIKDFFEGGKKGKLEMLNIISTCVHFFTKILPIYVCASFLGLGDCEPSLSGIQRIILP